MAAASGMVLVALSSTAKSASCNTTDNNDTCVIILGDVAGPHDGKAGTDKLQFNDSGNPLTVQGKTFAATPGTGIVFAGFESAEIITGTTLTILSETADTTSASSLAWTIQAGATLNVSGTGGKAIGDASSMQVDGTFNVLKSEVIGSLSGAATGSIVVSASQILSADGAASTFAGVISGAGGFTKGGAGSLILSGNNTFSGPLVVNGGTLILTGNNSSNGELSVVAGTLEVAANGAIDQFNKIDVGPGGQLTGTQPYLINATNGVTINGRITGDATINGNVSSNGGLQPGATAIPADGPDTPNPGQKMGQITINGNYTATGEGAYVGMFVDIDAVLAANVPGTSHDLLTINGTVSGAIPTDIYLAEFDAALEAGGATTGPGIQLVKINGTNAAGAFRQGNALTAGVYQYLLRYVENYAGTDDGYFLQSAIRDEMYAHPAILSANQALLRHCFRDDQRIPDSPKGATYGRAWFGYRQGNTSYGADTGIDMDQDFNCTTGGMDWRMGHGWFGGVSGGFGDSSADLVVPSGVGTLDGDARAIEVYASFTSASLFVNLSAGYSETDWRFVGALNNGATTSMSGVVASAQAGVALDLEPFAVKLIGAISYDGSDCGEDCLGISVSEDTGLIEGKATVRFDGVTWGGSIRPWAAVSYSDVLSDGINTVSLGGVAVSADTNSELLILDAGMQAYLDENFALYADGGYHESLSKDVTGYKAGIGLKLYW